MTQVVEIALDNLDMYFEELPQVYPNTSLDLDQLNVNKTDTGHPETKSYISQGNGKFRIRSQNDVEKFIHECLFQKFKKYPTQFGSPFDLLSVHSRCVINLSQ